jgi:hypothetical protein
MYKAIC